MFCLPAKTKPDVRQRWSIDNPTQVGGETGPVFEPRRFFATFGVFRGQEFLFPATFAYGFSGQLPVFIVCFFAGSPARARHRRPALSRVNKPIRICRGGPSRGSILL